MDETTTTDFVETQGTGARVHEGIAVDAEGNALSAEQVQALEPEAQPDQSAEAAPVDNSTDLKVESAALANKDLIDWAKKKGGFDTEDISPGAIRALEIARKTEQEFHDRNQQQSELRRQLDQVNTYQPPVYQQPYNPEPVLTGYDVNGQPLYSNPQPQPVTRLHRLILRWLCWNLE
jgi:hypothetical protein